MCQITFQALVFKLKKILILETCALLKTIKMRNKLILILSIYLFVYQNGFAQMQANNSLFNQNPTYYNPAFSGMQESALNFVFNSRANWVAANSITTTNNPWNAMLSLDKRFQDKNFGVSFNLTNVNVARINSIDLAGNFAYHINLGHDSKLTMGARVGVNYLNIGSIYLEDNTDAQFNNVGNYMIPKFGLGLLYKTENFWMGAASPDIFTYNYQNVLAASNSTFKRLVMNVNAGYKLMLNADFYFQPSVLYISSPVYDDKIDINLALGKNEAYWGGVSYSPLNSVSAMGGVTIKGRYNFAYAFSYNTSFTNTGFSSSHEITLNWDLEDAL